MKMSNSQQTIFRPIREERSLPECIQSLTRRIESYLEMADIPLSTYRGAALEALARDSAYADDELEERFPEVAKESLRRTYLARACIQLIGAEEAMSFGATDSAWYRCYVANHDMGLYEGSYRDPSFDSSRVDDARKGGENRGRTNDPTRDKLAEMIEELRPEGDWVSVLQIIKAVEKPLYKFNRASGGILVEDSFRQTLNRWLTDHRNTKIQAALGPSLRQ
ncbi:hypothetical protein HpMS107_58790 [Helicobacter pylori]|jgi:hypothetical protein